jgi:ATP-dependent DNA ligase
MPEQAFRATTALFDGEIVCLDTEGKPNFRNVILRMQQRSNGAIERARAKHPAVCYLFDCLYLDGRAITNEPLQRRREWLLDAVRNNPAYRVSEAVDEGHAFLEAVRQLGLEGIMAKQRTSPYIPGKRSECWLKIKTRQTTECLVIGYTRGKGDRESTFGALHIARRTGPVLEYLGKVGGGYDQSTLANVWSELRKLTPGIRPVKEKPVDGAGTVWVEPTLVCEVQFASLTSDGKLREPVFLRMRPDLTDAPTTT